ncbi:MAG: hypothetical protein LIO93_04950 [Bacteroidales bacterium]|nr:hypothetical protein [Bacteroidales bacterium]
MKNKLLLLMWIVSAIFQQEVFAQLPEISTADNDAWYYIHVGVNGSCREDRVFVAKGTTVFVETLNKASDAQLFRFEKQNNNYFIINKSTSKRLYVGKVDNEECLTLSDAGTEFKLDPLADHYFNITATKTPTGDDATKKWAHQSNSGSSYKIILVNTSWSSGENSQFSFIPYEDMNLEYSDAKTNVWYTINSSEKGADPVKCMTDVSTSTNSTIKIAVEEAQENNSYQLWKLVKKGSLTNFVNKATGNIIQTQSNISEPNIMYNYTQLTTDEADSKGWSLKHIRAGQYAIYGVEEDNITRYLTVTTEGVEPGIYDPNNLIFSKLAWKFNKVSTETSLPEIYEKDDIRIYSENKKIVVTGADNYTIRNIQGIVVNRNIELPVGIYLVTVEGKTTKVLVK